MTNERPANAGAGSLKRNTKKERPSQPDYLGSIEIHGAKYWISGWINSDEASGAKWLKLVARDVEERQQQDRDQRSLDDCRLGGGRMPGRDDPIPFGAEGR